MKQNYIDEKGNYHNELNLTLAQIYDSGVDFGRSVAKADFKTELEKIKADILNLGFTGWANKPKLDREEVLTILNKYISALSGDNKQSRCNSCLNNTDELSGECYECVKGIEDWYEPISELKGENNG